MGHTNIQMSACESVVLHNNIVGYCHNDMTRDKKTKTNLKSGLRTNSSQQKAMWTAPKKPIIAMFLIPQPSCRLISQAAKSLGLRLIGQIIVILELRVSKRAVANICFDMYKPVISSCGWGSSIIIIMFLHSRKKNKQWPLVVFRSDWVNWWNARSFRTDSQVFPGLGVGWKGVTSHSGSVLCLSRERP